jgi:hypothetical protein
LYISLFFFFLSNEYFSFSESLHYGAADGYFYNIIAENFPGFPREEINFHYAQRFLIPYFILIRYLFTSCYVYLLYGAIENE